MLYITSTNAASYITVKTGVVANVVHRVNESTGKQRNYFEFDDCYQVIIAFEDYREATKLQKELTVDIVAFIRQFSYYKNESRRVTQLNR